MNKNKKLFVIVVIFLFMICCMRCARADYVDDPDPSVSTVTVLPSPSPWPSPSPSSLPSPSPSPAPDYSAITLRLDDIYQLNSDSNFKILISIWSLVGLMIGYVIIKDSFR